MKKLFKSSKQKKPELLFPWPDYRIRPFVETSVESLGTPSNPSPDTKEPREKESALDVLGNFLFGARDVSRPWSERDHDKDRQREDRFVEPPDITQMIGRLTATASEDWTAVLELCEYASANETAAKEAAGALRREFTYADPSAQLTAARLWAIMLQNCSEEFIEQSASRKNMDAIEDVITSNRTNPVVRERLLEVLGSAVYHHTKNDRRHPFAVLWRKVKPPSAPEQGRPIDLSDSMYTPPVHNAAQQTSPPPPQIQHTPTPPVQTRQLPTPPDAISTPAIARPASELPPELSPVQSSTKKIDLHNRIIPVEEEMQRTLHECEDAHNSAHLLGDFLASATLVDVETDADGVVRELYTKCIASQERIVSQILWATSIAEKSRDEVKNLIVPSPPVTNQPPQPSLVTKEEEMLAMLLGANQTLFESIHLHDEFLRLATAERVEGAVEERSKFDTTLDRSQMYVAADGSLYAPENEVVRGGSSRSPSPNPHLSNLTETPPASFYSPIPQSSPPPHHLLQTDIGYPQNQYQNPVPVYSTLNGPWTNTPNELNQTSQNNPHNVDLSTQPRPAFHGPRTFISLSRTPSPELSSNQGHRTGLGLHGSTTTVSIAAGRPASPLPRSAELQSESVRDRRAERALEERTRVDDNTRRRPNLLHVVPQDILPEPLSGVMLESPFAVTAGSYATVFKGSWKSRPVALKLLRSANRPEIAKKRFQGEIGIWRELRHRNVLPFFGHYADDNGAMYMISPWCQHGDINNYLLLFPNTDREILVLQLLYGLEHLHERGVIHGDLRGANILISDDREVWIADFGLSKYLDQSPTSTVNRGNIRWMAPELLDLEIPRGDLTPYTEATDIYSFAMTTIEVYTGSMPFPHLRHNVGAALLAQARPSRPGADGASHSIGDNLWDIIQKCWVEEPAHRLSAGDARQRLEIHRKGRLPIAI